MIFNMTGGAPLNFKVKAYASELLLPASAAENTIAVITETPISGYQFSVEEPENPVEGFVWACAGTESVAPFSVTRKNPMLVYPIYAKQYVSGAWVDVATKTYQNGAWVEWLKELYLLKGGDYCEFNSGGWTMVRSYSDLNSSTSVVGSAIRFNTSMGSNQSSYTYFHANHTFDMANYSRVCVNVTNLQCNKELGSDKLNHALLRVLTPAKAIVSSLEITSTGLKTIDLSNLTGEHYVAIWLSPYYGVWIALDTDKLWLERL